MQADTRRKRLHSIGVSVTETTPEMRIAAVIVTANSRNSRPSMPLMNSIGMNTAASDDRHRENREADFLRARSATPRAALSPCSMCRTMFSSITIASSTTKPIERMSAIIDRLSRLKSQQLHDGERAEDRERQRQRRDDRGRAVVQEHEDDADDEHERDEHRDLDVAERRANRLRPVARGRQVDRGRQLRRRSRQQRADASVTSIVFVPGCRMHRAA